MEVNKLQKAIHISYPIISITRMNYEGEPTELKSGCTLRDSFQKALTGRTVYITEQTCSCNGSAVGFGFRDGLPDTPGGFGYFLSYGKGEGFPTGEKVKINPAVAEAMIAGQPQKVMKSFDTIRLKPFEADDKADTVVFLAKPDELSALIHLYNFRESSFDNVIAPVVSGCASIFRIPFGEKLRKSGRAVIGNVDLVSRLHFDSTTFFFIVSNERFLQMLEDADDCFLQEPYWRGIEKRMI